MPRFYVNLILEEKQELTLPLAVVRHIKVLRLYVNSEIALFNGDGNEYLATLMVLDKRLVKVWVHTKIIQTKLSKLEIKLAICLIANDKMDLVIQKAVELGVNEIIPIISERSKQIAADKVSNRLLHWHNIIISSTEQCGRNILAKISEPLAFNQLLDMYSNIELKLICSPQNTKSKLAKIMPKSLLLLVGPEGGFTSSEVELAIMHSYQMMQLGQNILRAETAAIVGLSVVQTIYANFLVNVDDHYEKS